ncbi:hypothetical protein BHE74_00047692, partial [Ensete ventricosum]
GRESRCAAYLSLPKQQTQFLTAVCLKYSMTASQVLREIRTLLQFPQRITPKLSGPFYLYIYVVGGFETVKASEGETKSSIAGSDPVRSAMSLFGLGRYLSIAPRLVCLLDSL